ncbi:MAG: MBL fold metallo-hydrolase [Chitinophagales bacterium]
MNPYRIEVLSEYTAESQPELAVYIVGSADLTSPEDCCIYLINSGGRLALIDAGAGSSVRKIIDNITNLGFSPTDVDYIIATHGHIDHIGGLKELAQLLQARVVCHEKELPAISEGKENLTAAWLYGVRYQPVDVDMVLRDEETSIEFGSLVLNCLYTPGHTVGGISVYLDIPEGRVLFGQDIHGPFNPSWGSDLNAWTDSMQRLLALKADCLCEGHFGIYTPRGRAEEYIKRYLTMLGKTRKSILG